MLGAINNDDVNHVITGHEQNNTLSDLTAFRAPGWVDGPSYRGTASLLWSCFFTLSASLYTVVRPNVPTQSHKALDRARDRAFCVAMAALFPEFILRLAQEQFYQAFWLRETLNELLETSPGRRKSRPYTLAFCFYVVMGGISVPREGASAKDDRRLSPIGAAELARRGNFIDMDEGWLARTARTTIFQRPLVFLQAVWMILQCVVRACLGLHVSLLEIHTTIGIYVAAVLVSLWSYKPDGTYMTYPLSADGLEKDITEEKLRQLLPSSAFSEPPPKNLPKFWDDQYHFLATPQSRLRSRPWILSPNRVSGPRLFITLTVVHSAFPLVAWNYPFPSRIEEVLWKTASLFLIGLWLCSGIMIKGNKWFGWVDVILDRRQHRGPKSMYGKFAGILTSIVALVLLLFFVAAKVLLCLLPLLSLRNVSVATLVLPNWLTMVPHI